MSLEIHRTRRTRERTVLVIETYGHNNAGVLSRVAELLSPFDKDEIMQVGTLDWWKVFRPGVVYDVKVVEVDYVN